MANKKSSHVVTNNLDSLINREIGKRMATNGIKVLKSDVMAEIAETAGVGWDNINMIKRGMVTPSLPVAIKIAHYFNLTVEDVFKLQ